MPYELFLALRYLLAKRKQTFLSLISLISILGIAVGVMALVLALALTTGFQEDIATKILGATSDITVFGGWGERNIREVDRVLEVVSEVEGVAAAAPLVVEKGLIVSDLNPRGYAAVIQGVDPRYQSRVTTLVQDLVRGAAGDAAGAAPPRLTELRLARPAGAPGGPRHATVFLGKDLAFNLGVRAGDRVRLIIPQARLSPFAVRPKSALYEVAGVADSGFFDYDNSRVYMHLEEAQRLFAMGEGQVTAIQVKLASFGRVSEVRD